MGHATLARAPGDDFPSVCPFHQSCAEGLASGPAIQRRFGARLTDLAADHPAHGLIAGYLGQLLAALVLTAAPRRIVIGGGVAKTPALHTGAHVALLRRLDGYGLYPAAEHPDFIARPALGDDAGLVGALLIGGETAATTERP
jgi:fructokinase